MVGLGIAIAGGLAKGWGAGQLEAIKAKREEKLKMLEYDLENRRLALTASEGAANRASQEKLTQAQLGVQERLGNLSATTSKQIAALQEKGATERTLTTTRAQKEIAEAGNLSAESIAEANRTTQELIANLQTDSAKEVAKMQIEGQQALNSTLLPMADGTWKLKVGNELRDLGNDPKTGKPLQPLATDDDTPEMKNYKYMVSIGMDPRKAMQIFTSKNADPTLIKASLVETYVKAQTTFGNATAKTIENAEDWADSTMQRLGIEPPTAAPDSATAPEIDTTGMNREDIIRQIKEALAAGLPKDDPALRAVMRKEGINPADVGL